MLDFSNPAVAQFWHQLLQTGHQMWVSNRQDRMLREHRESQMTKNEEILERLRAIHAHVNKDGSADVDAAEAVAVEQESSEPYSRYAPDMDVSISCVPCTRAHLATMASSLREADTNPSRIQAAREEATALLEYDLTPEKLAVTPEQDRRVMEVYAERLKGLKSKLDGPVPEATLASASLKEAMRFAREDGVAHPEVQLRMERTEEAINQLERVTFAPEKLKSVPAEEAKRARELLPEIRKARQDLLNHVRSPEDLERVTAEVALIDAKLNPPPTPDVVDQLATEAQTLNREFRSDVLKSWMAHKEETQHATDAHTQRGQREDAQEDSGREHRPGNRRRETA